MTVILAIDTTTRGGSVALAQDGDLRALVHHDPADGYAESLLELCEEVHRRAALPWTALDGIAVVQGPGSFTGLRIGIMTAKTLAHARGWELWTSGSLPLVAAAAGLDTQIDRIGLLDAGAAHVFAGVVAQGATQAEVERVAWEDLRVWADERAPGRGIALEAALEAQARDHLPGWSLHPVDSLAATLARRASRQEQPAVRVEPHELLPLYASMSQAERVHGVDLREHVHRRIEPTGWE